MSHSEQSHSGVYSTAGAEQATMRPLAVSTSRRGGSDAGREVRPLPAMLFWEVLDEGHQHQSVVPIHPFCRLEYFLYFIRTTHDVDRLR